MDVTGEDKYQLQRYTQCWRYCQMKPETNVWSHRFHTQPINQKHVTLLDYSYSIKSLFFLLYYIV